MNRRLLLAFALLFGCFQTKPHKSSCLKIGSTTIPSTLDPGKSSDFASATVLNLLYEGLTRCSHLGAADTVEISSDHLTYTFCLRNAFWSDGSAVTANDFVLSWKRSINPNHPSPSSFLFFSIKNAEAIVKKQMPLDQLGVWADGDQTLVVQLERPSPEFQSIISLPPFLPIPSHLSENEIEKGSVVNGPYLLTDRSFTSHLTLKKNPTYWNQKEVGPDEIQIQIIPDEQTAIHLFEQKKLDWIGGSLSPLPVDAVGHSTEKIRTQQIGATTFCAFNTQIFPLNDPAFRKALSLSIDRLEIAEKLLNLDQIPATRFLPPVLCGGKNRDLMDQKIPELDPEMIKNLPPLTLDIRASALSKLLAQTIQSQWEKKLGIKVKIIQTDAKTHIEKLRTGQYQIALANWISFYDDPINLLERFHGQNDPKNYAKWQSLNYQHLLELARLEIDPSKREKLYENLEDILAHEMPIAPIYHWSSAMLVQPRVKNLKLSLCGAVLFEWCQLADADGS